MGNKAEKRPKRMDWVTKYGRMLKKMLTSPDDATNTSPEANAVSVSPPRAVSCEELFLASEKKKGHRRPGDSCVDPFVAAHIAAQNHFSLRPNIYL
ncbi:hypothetical protein COLO4_07255 [Corchorus olitorius]|uniref:Uncharacterized protein n=1 Tax=Corchorus olitorius TaxID=93759 RepID=A0A1R3KK98_9ROSI|nr:hypothetical protein COLO4_07255 [Corchorus olitorius]